MLRIIHILLHKIFTFCALQLLNSIKKERGIEKYTIISTSDVSRSRVVRKPENPVARRMRVMWRCRGRWFLKRSVKVILCWFIEAPSKLSCVEGHAAVDDNRIVVIVVAVRKRENLAVYRVAGNRVKE